ILCSSRSLIAINPIRNLPRQLKRGESDILTLQDQDTSTLRPHSICGITRIMELTDRMATDEALEPHLHWLTPDCYRRQPAGFFNELALRLI
ncbi:hypothetical protein, partial [Phyllobacterium zundukense]